MSVSLKTNPVPANKNSSRIKAPAALKPADSGADSVAVTTDQVTENVGALNVETRAMAMRRKPVVVSIMDGVASGTTHLNDAKLDCRSDGIQNTSEAQKNHPVNGLPQSPATLSSITPSRPQSNNNSTDNTSSAVKVTISSTKSAGTPPTASKTTTNNDTMPVAVSTSESTEASRVSVNRRPWVPSHYYAMNQQADLSTYAMYATGVYPGVAALHNRQTTSDIHHQQHQLQQQQQQHQHLHHHHHHHQQQQQQYLWPPDESQRIHQTSLALSELALGDPVVTGTPHRGQVAPMPQFQQASTADGNPGAPPPGTDDRKVVYLPPNEALPYGFHSSSLPYGVSSQYPTGDPVMLAPSYCLPPLTCDPSLVGGGGGATSAGGGGAGGSVEGVTGWTPACGQLNSQPGYWYFPQASTHVNSPAGTGYPSPAHPPTVLPEAKPGTLHRSGVGMATVNHDSRPITSGVANLPPASTPVSAANGYPQWTVSPNSVIRQLPGAGWNPASYYLATMAAMANLTGSQQQNGPSFAQYRALLNRLPQTNSANPGFLTLPRVMIYYKGFDVDELRRLNIPVNPPDFDESLLHGARYFVIKSDCEENVHQAIRHGCWCSTRSGNQRLNEAFHSLQRDSFGQQSGSTGSPPNTDLESSFTETREENTSQVGSLPAPTCGHILLFFSIRSSGSFAGVAEMVGPVEANVQLDIWRDTRFRGKIPVRWLYVKNVPNQLLRHICVESYENRSVTLLRDTSEVIPASKGEEMLRIIHNYDHLGG